MPAKNAAHLLPQTLASQYSEDVMADKNQYQLISAGHESGHLVVIVLDKTITICYKNNNLF